MRFLLAGEYQSAPDVSKTNSRKEHWPVLPFPDPCMLITRTFQLSPQAINILDAIAEEFELHDLSEAVEYCILKQRLNDKELAHALLARLSSKSLRAIDEDQP